MAITFVSGARVAYEFGTGVAVGPSGGAEAVEPSWRFTAVACDLVAHIGEVTGLRGLSAGDISRTLRTTAREHREQQQQQQQQQQRGAGLQPLAASPYSLDRAAFNA